MTAGPDTLKPEAHRGYWSEEEMSEISFERRYTVNDTWIKGGIAVQEMRKLGTVRLPIPGTLAEVDAWTAGDISDTQPATDKLVFTYRKFAPPQVPREVECIVCDDVLVFAWSGSDRPVPQIIRDQIEATLTPPPA